MQPDQQQRIMGFFIDEAKDHLNTIEQGLLNLQSTVEDPEMINEVFRAAHSVKGGAAMLGLNPIQRVSHRMEDFFKILKEAPIQVDQKLESLFLKVFDALQALLTQLQTPFGLTEEISSQITQGIEPTFTELEQHLHQLAGTPRTAAAPVVAPVSSNIIFASQLEESLELLFRNEVPQQLREMLQLFKQPESPSTRQQLQELCRSLASLGEQYQIYPWCQLIETARRAIVHPENGYRLLAPIVIKDIKLAQELVLAGRITDITPSPQLQELAPVVVPPVTTVIQDGQTDLITDFDEIDSPEVITETSPALDLAALGSDPTPDLAATLEEDLIEPDLTFHQGPEVGMAELNSLADLFEGEMPELALTWQQEEVLTNESELLTPETQLGEAEIANDFADLLFDGEISQGAALQSSSDDLDDLFDDTPATSSDLVPSSHPVQLNSADQFDDFADLLEISNPSSSSTLASPNLELDSDVELLDSTADNALELELLGLDATDLVADTEQDSSFDLGLDLDGSLNDLGDLFAGLTDGDLAPSIEAKDATASTTTDNENSAENKELADTANLFDESSDIDYLADLESLNLFEEIEEIDAATSSTDVPANFASASSADLDLDLFEELPLNELGTNDSDTDPSGLGESSLDDFNLDDYSPTADTDLTVDSSQDELFADLIEPDLTIVPTPEPQASSLESTTSSYQPLVFESDPWDDNNLADLAPSTDTSIDLLSENDSSSDESTLLGDLDNLDLENINLEDDNFFHQSTPDVPDFDQAFSTDEFSLDSSLADLQVEPLTTPARAIDPPAEPTPQSTDDLTFDLELATLSDDDDLIGLVNLDSDAPVANSSDNLDELFSTIIQDEPLFDQSLTVEADDFAISSDDSLLLESALTESDDLFRLDTPLEVESSVSNDLFDLDTSDDAELLNPDDLFDLDGLESSTETTSSIASTDLFDLDAGNDSLESQESFELDPLTQIDGSDLFDLDAGNDSLESQESFELDPLTQIDGSDLFDLDAGNDSLESQESFELDPLTQTNELELEFSESDDIFDLDASSVLTDPLLTSVTVVNIDESSLIVDDLLNEFDLSSSDADQLGELLEFDTPASEVDELDDLNLALDDPQLEDVYLDNALAQASALDEISLFAIDTEIDSSTPVELIELGDDSEDAIADFADWDNLLTEPSVDPDLDGLDDLLQDAPQPASSTTNAQTEFDQLDSLLEDDAQVSFADLDALLDSSESVFAVSPESTAFDTPVSVFDVATTQIDEDDFSDLESLLTDSPSLQADRVASPAAPQEDSEFDELDHLLKITEEQMPGSPSVRVGAGIAQSRRSTSRGFSEQTMRVPVKHLDNLSNLVGELVVNRNSLEQDQERLRQSLDNLLYQVQQLSDVGQRMQDLYERSLLESSLLASRQGYRHSSPLTLKSSDTTIVELDAEHSTGIEYDPLEMDRFTGFHSLSQEMIELIVRVRESSSDIEFIVDETEQVTRMFRQVTTQLQEGLTRSRMVPFAQTADRLPRAVRDISMKVGKQADLVIEGRETLIDKMILEQLYDPMTHLVNNAITHGIELPSVRAAAGKPPAGRITIRAFHQGNQTIISVSDDGAGIDVERVKRKAIEKGLITMAEAQNLSRLDVYDILFHPGFSTKDQADDFSGRGVGMDVVRTSLSEIRGVINTDSSSGKGTTFTIRLPLTLSISKALCCISNRARIAFPMDGVEDMLDLPKERIQTNADGQPMIAWRDSVLPVRPLADLLAYNRHLSRGTVYGGSQEDDMVSVVVLRSAGNFLALQVDQVMGEQEIVIKQLEGPVPKPIGVAGATVLGDGRIMPIADVLELIDLSMGRIRRDAGGSLWEQSSTTPPPETATAKTEPMVLIVDDSITVRELLSMTFNKVGYRVEQARDGQEAWEKLRSGLPCDIVFCDIEMPRMDGLELLSRIQKDPNLKSLPIAMLTSRGADRHRQMASSLGASGYFTKPYLEEALLDAAQRMLKGERLLNS